VIQLVLVCIETMDIEQFFSGDNTFNHKYCVIELPYIIRPLKSRHFFPELHSYCVILAWEVSFHVSVCS